MYYVEKVTNYTLFPHVCVPLKPRLTPRLPRSAVRLGHRQLAEGEHGDPGQVSSLRAVRPRRGEVLQLPRPLLQLGGRRRAVRPHGGHHRRRQARSVGRWRRRRSELTKARKKETCANVVVRRHPVRPEQSRPDPKHGHVGRGVVGGVAGGQGDGGILHRGERRGQRRVGAVQQQTGERHQVR